MGMNTFNSLSLIQSFGSLHFFQGHTDSVILLSYFVYLIL
jgi:hypothetical protein